MATARSGFRRPPRSRPMDRRAGHGRRNFFLDNTGSSTGPELKYGGAAVTAGEFAGWTAIGAVQVAGGGYDVAWKNTSARPVHGVEH